MRISELLELLENIQEDFPDEDPEVRLAMQPLCVVCEYSIHAVTPVFLEDHQGGVAPVVYLSEGTHLGYLPCEAQDAVW